MSPPASSPSDAESVLGLDLGANSVGWCLLSARGGKPTAIVAMGARVFESGMEGELSTGRAEPRGRQRRQARQRRRILDRRARRKRKLLHLLQGSGLLPQGRPGDAIAELDAQLLSQQFDQLVHGHPWRERLAQVLPYWLRKEALERKLHPHELGRALYHLGQRRGFQSNRRAAPKKGEDDGLIRKSISQTRSEMAAASARTLGEYFASLDPYERSIRRRWTSRDMYRTEFEAIWASQRKHHPQVLTDGLKKRIEEAIFHQRPLRSAKGLVGSCSHERGSKRAAMALLCAQRFRLLQKVNDSRVINPPPAGDERRLTPDERAKLVEALHREGDLTFTKAKRLLGLTPRHKFTFEEGGEKRFVGNRTNVALRKVFADRWSKFTPRQRDAIVHDLRSFQNAEALARRAVRVWGLDVEAAREFAELRLERGYANLSQRAIGRLLPEMETGTPYAEAVKRIYGETTRRVEPQDSLPPVSKVRELRNPVVTRVLTEARKVVNALVARYGKPTRVRVELARDLRRSRKHRIEATLRIRANERARAQAAQKIRAETSLGDPRPDDILKVLLAEECQWQCPYTGRAISMGALLGDNPEFDIEHIIPFGRCLDDSFVNKTLCYHEENRQVKGNRTPSEAYGGTGRWSEIVDRVGAFRGRAAREKLRRFQLTAEELESLEDFTSSQLNDTRYASKLAMEYLALLYGGLWDASGVRRVQASRGGVTRYVRQAYGLNAILGEGPTKSRDDYRHHSVDALAVAITDPAMIQRLSDAAVRAWERRGKRRHFERIEEPWPGFFTDACEAVRAIHTSHRVCRRARGPLHQDTIYAEVRRRDPENGRMHEEFRVRKPLAKLSARDVRSIADPKIRRIVQDALDRSGESPKRAFADLANHPCIPPKSPGARAVPIHSVRVRVGDLPRPVGHGDGERYVVTEKNHHVEIWALLDSRGHEAKWEGHVVSLLEAATRVRHGEPLVHRDHGPGTRFKFSLAPGETVRLTHPRREPELAVVRSVSVEKTGSIRVEFVDVNDARKAQDIKGAKRWFKPALDTLRKLRCEKGTVSPLGEVHSAND